jgi:hypothetical protein
MSRCTAWAAQSAAGRPRILMSCCDSPPFCCLVRAPRMRSSFEQHVDIRRAHDARRPHGCPRCCHGRRAGSTRLPGDGCGVRYGAHSRIKAGRNFPLCAKSRHQPSRSSLGNNAVSRSLPSANCMSQRRKPGTGERVEKRFSCGNSACSLLPTRLIRKLPNDAPRKPS